MSLVIRTSLRGMSYTSGPLAPQVDTANINGPECKGRGIPKQYYACSKALADAMREGLPCNRGTLYAVAPTEEALMRALGDRSMFGVHIVYQ